MRTVSINVYDYEDIEKDENLRKKVIENNGEINNTEDWYLDILPKCVKYIEACGFINVELNFKGLVNCDAIDFKANFDSFENFIYPLQLKEEPYMKDLRSLNDLSINLLKEDLKKDIYNIVKEYYNYLISDEQILNTIKEKNYEVNSYGFIVDFD